MKSMLEQFICNLDDFSIEYFFSKAYEVRIVWKIQEFPIWSPWFCPKLRVFDLLDTVRHWVVRTGDSDNGGGGYGSGR